MYALLFCAEIRAIYRRQPFYESSLDRESRECKKLQPQTSSVLCIFFHYSELKCFPRSPTLYIHSSISLHLVGPTYLSLICLPCTISHFSPSVNYLLAYYTPSLSLRLFPSLLSSLSLSLTHSSLALSFSSSITFWHLTHQLFHSSHLSSRQIKFPLSPHYNNLKKGKKR